MKTLHDFIDFTNLKGNRIKLTLTLIVASILYSTVLAMVQTMIYMGNPIYYYIVLYVFVVWAAFIFMIILFQFVQKKRKRDNAIKIKSYILPCIFVQSIYFVVMIGLGLLTFAQAGSSSSLYYVLTPLCIIMTMIYVPLQLFSFFAIYEGERNPFIIIKKALQVLCSHYRSCFYSMIIMVVIMMLYRVILNTGFHISQSFIAFQAVQDIMVSSNPFNDAVSYFIYAMQNAKLWLPCIIAFVYGIVMCIALCYFYMMLICIYDNDIKE